MHATNVDQVLGTNSLSEFVSGFVPIEVSGNLLVTQCAGEVVLCTEFEELQELTLGGSLLDGFQAVIRWMQHYILMIREMHFKTVNNRFVAVDWEGKY
jgi:hypothetical protein